MVEGTVAQEYLLATLGEKGKLPAAVQVRTCLVAAGLLDLLLKGCVGMEQKKVSVRASLPAELAFLSQLYELIGKKPRTVQSIGEEYLFSLTDRRLQDLFDAIGKTLVQAGCAKAEEGGLLEKTNRYVPDKEAVDRLVQKIRAALLEEGPVDPQTFGLVSLLDKSGQLKQYFSSYERETLKTRLRQLKDTEADPVVKQMVDHVNGLMVLVISLSIH